MQHYSFWRIRYTKLAVGNRLKYQFTWGQRNSNQSIVSICNFINQYCTIAFYAEHKELWVWEEQYQNEITTHQI